MTESNSAVLDEEKEFPVFMHHNAVRKKLREFVESGKIVIADAECIYIGWRERCIQTGTKRKAMEAPPGFEEMKNLLKLESEEFNRACPMFGNPIPAYGDLPDLGKRLIRIFGPGEHHRRVWRTLGFLAKKQVIDYPIMMETYRVWRAMVGLGLNK